MSTSFVVKAFRVMQYFMNVDRIDKKTPTYGTKEEADINYFGERGRKSNKFHLLDVYGPAGVDKKEKLPVIVEVHGGGYTTCYKEINRQHGMWFASQGYRVVNVNYTLIPEGTVAEEMQELRQVFRWMEKNAGKYGFDMDRLYLTGDSSGGHLVLLYGALQVNSELQKICAVEPMTKPIKAVCATCPVGSFQKTDLVSRALVKFLLGDSFALHNDTEKFSYQSFLQPGMLPTFIVTTKSDVGIHNVTASIHKDMIDKGIEHAYACYQKQENKLAHVFNVLNPDWVESIQANKDILAFFAENS